MPSVDDPRHAKLQSDVTLWLESNGYSCADFTYHENINRRTSSLLSLTDNETSLHVRTREDHLAIHERIEKIGPHNDRFTFQYELKTKGCNRRDESKGNGVDMTVEVFPMVCHWLLAVNMNVQCLYIYRDEFQDIECGFWSDDIPTIRQLWIPPRGLHLKDRILKADWLNGVPIVERGCGGSGDPFVIVDVSVLRQLPHWQELIERKRNNVR